MNNAAFVDERIFRPLPGRQVRFDAVYDARLSPFKRHALAAEVPNLALVTYLHEGQVDPDYRAAVAPIVARAHVFNGDPFSGAYRIACWPEEVNQALNQCAVGLALSREEGSMFASIQYLLAGLPVVSTPSLGGRDDFYHPDYVRIVDADTARGRGRRLGAASTARSGPTRSGRAPSRGCGSIGSGCSAASTRSTPARAATASSKRNGRRVFVEQAARRRAGSDRRGSRCHRESLGRLRRAATMAPQEPIRAGYESRLAARRADAAAARRRAARISHARLAVFSLGVVLAGIAFGAGRVDPRWLLAPGLGFIALVIVHDRVLRRAETRDRSVRYYEEGIARLDARFAGRGASGERFRDPEHPYADDLDLFGAGGLFELLCRARTAAGEAMLAAWLLAPRAERRGARAPGGRSGSCAPSRTCANRSRSSATPWPAACTPRRSSAGASRRRPRRLRRCGRSPPRCPALGGARSPPRSPARRC